MLDNALELTSVTLLYFTATLFHKKGGFFCQNLTFETKLPEFLVIKLCEQQP